ncbi:MAG: hypothetical protein HY814_13855 [Candidatus Riflebacteria bacterium]|nr:hypothetical protein [Candidatus Riflebacteria bacterium]
MNGGQLTLRTSGEHRNFPVAAADEQGICFQWQQPTTLGWRRVAGGLQDCGLGTGQPKAAFRTVYSVTPAKHVPARAGSGGPEIL